MNAKMKEFFSIGEAAHRAGVTTETLRHYDRIGLVTPCKVDEWTGYRNYSESDLVRIRVIRALQAMELSLREIGDLLSLNDFPAIAALLRRAEVNATRKIEELQTIRASIVRARTFYEEKQREITTQDSFLRELPRRELLLSDTLTTPTVETFFGYQRHFFAQIGAQREAYAFEDLAGVLEEDGKGKMFAVCTRHPDDAPLRVLPAGKFLCARCKEEERGKTSKRLKNAVRERFLTAPAYALHIVVLTGILQWEYEIQVPIA